MYEVDRHSQDYFKSQLLAESVNGDVALHFETGVFGLVDVQAISELSKPFTLAQAKSDPKLAKMTLVRFSRLSVQPVTADEWRYICKLGGVRPL